jgi:hypothetical protein
MAIGLLLLRVESESEVLDRHRYAELGESLLYLSNGTRPDTVHAVGLFLRHMAAPTQSHWEAAVPCWIT